MNDTSTCVYIYIYVHTHINIYIHFLVPQNPRFVWAGSANHFVACRNIKASLVGKEGCQNAKSGATSYYFHLVCCFPDQATGPLLLVKEPLEGFMGALLFHP